MMQILDTSVRADTLKLEVVLDVLCRCAIGISGLDDPNLDLVGKASSASEVAEERGRESRDAITVEQDEFAVAVNKVVDQTISIAIERRAAIVCSCL